MKIILQTQRNIVVIPKTVNKNRLIENMSIFDFKLDQADMDYIASFERNGRQCALDKYKDHKHWPFNIEF